MAKRYRRKYPSKIGRPRVEGERSKDGHDVKRPGPSKELLAQRKALCADPNMSTNPLDCAFANGWLTEKDHRIGRRYAAIYTQCGFRVGSITASSASEVDIGGELTHESLAQMSDAVIGAAWDNITDRTRGQGGGDGASLDQWNVVNACLTAAQRQQVYLVCIMDSWPQWVIQRNRAKQLEAEYEALAKIEKRSLSDEEQAKIFKHKHSHWERSYDHLVSGLAAIRKALAKPRVAPPTPPKPVSAYLIPPRPKKRAETTHYVDTDGIQILEVVRMVAADTAS